MCIKTITAYQDSKGGMYPLETTALIAEAGIITNASLSILQGLFGHADTLIPLFQRYAAIQAEKAKVEAPSAEPTTLSPQELYERRAALLGRLQTWAQTDAGKTKAKQFIESGGYANLTDLKDRATDTDVAAMHGELNTLGVA